MVRVVNHGTVKEALGALIGQHSGLTTKKYAPRLKTRGNFYKGQGCVRMCYHAVKLPYLYMSFLMEF